MARLVVPGALRPLVGGAGQLEIDLPDGATLVDLLDAVTGLHPALNRRVRDEQGTLRRYVNVYVDGEDVRASGGLATPVPPGAEVFVLPSVAGG